MSLEKILNGVSCFSTPRIRVSARLVEMPLREGGIPNAPKPTQLLNFLKRKGIWGNVISKDVFEKKCNDVFSNNPVRPH